MKFRNRDACHSMVCSLIILNVAIWSTHERSCLNLACSSRIILSISFKGLFGVVKRNNGLRGLTFYLLLILNIGTPFALILNDQNLLQIIQNHT